MNRKIEVDSMMTVGTLAELLLLPVSKLITELMKNGIFATVNEKIDYETAQIIVEELGLEVELTKKQVLTAADKLKERSVRRQEGGATRPPIIAVMGHVDHGKTSLLDNIRGTSVVKGEAGGITQHISSYQIEHNNRPITFLDTPGHEAFAALREHGARLTDLVVIVIAADDGIKPQTLEAIRFARKAGVKMIIAMNKMDKEGANVDRLKQQLAEQNLLVEEWGGDTVTVPVSAKTGEGVDKLLDMVFLMTDIEELTAKNDVPARGLVIESHMEVGRGPVAVVLVEEGTLKTGQFVVAGEAYGKVRNLESTLGKPIKEAPPSTPAMVSGFKNLPQFTDEFQVVASEKEAKALAIAQKSGTSSNAYTNLSSSEMLRIMSRSSDLSELNVMVKADVQGSLTSVIDSLKTLGTEEVAVRIVGSGVGNITESDIYMASSSKAIIYGFHIDLPAGIKQLASREKVGVRLYKIIYELIDDAKSELSELLAPEIIETEKGKLVVKGVFKTTKNEIICGGEVTSGKLTLPATVKIERAKEVIGEAELTGLKRGPQEASEVVEGEMCGMSLKTTDRINIEEGDKLTFFTRETKERKL
ncbi:MAG: translation initiation factor IF-2 [bacterium]|nr:translation initiation factor IF-2 [bacterium]